MSVSDGYHSDMVPSFYLKEEFKGRGREDG